MIELAWLYIVLWLIGVAIVTIVALRCFYGNRGNASHNELQWHKRDELHDGKYHADRKRARPDRRRPGD